MKCESLISNKIIKLFIIGTIIQEIQNILEILDENYYTEYIDDNNYDDTDWYLSD